MFAIALKVVSFLPYKIYYSQNNQNMIHPNILILRLLCLAHCWCPKNPYSLFTRYQLCGGALGSLGFCSIWISFKGCSVKVGSQKKSSLVTFHKTIFLKIDINSRFSFKIYFTRNLRTFVQFCNRKWGQIEVPSGIFFLNKFNSTIAFGFHSVKSIHFKIKC